MKFFLPVIIYYVLYYIMHNVILYNYIIIYIISQLVSLSFRIFNFSRIHTTSSAETVRSCLDVIAICSVVPKVMLLLCERVDMPDMSMTMAINLLLAAAECEIIADADVQRAALRAVINCVCAPINRVYIFPLNYL